MVGRLAFRWGIVAVLIVLLASGTIGGALVYGDMTSHGMQEKWTYPDSGIVPDRAHEILLVDENGTTLLRETGYNDTTFEMTHGIVALNPNGSVKWKVATNSFANVVKGDDGRFFYTDLKNASSTSWRFGNLTAIDGNGRYLWSYHSLDGDLEAIGTFPDGCIVARHTNGLNNHSSPEYVDELIGLSTTGEVRWVKQFNTKDGAFYDDSIRFNWNGTLVYTAYRPWDSRFLGLNQNGEELWNSTLPVEWGLSYPFRGPVWYVASTAVVDDASGVTTVTAFDTRTWSIAWTTTVDHCSNSNIHYPMGYWTSYEGIVDGKGDIYCPFYRLDSNEPRMLSILSPDGSVISKSTVRGEILGAFRSGGLLTYYWPDHDLLALDSHGGQQWKYDVGNATTYYGMMLGNNDGIYLSNFTHIFALARSPGTDIGMFVASILVIDISVVAAMFWTRRNRLKT